MSLIPCSYWIYASLDECPPTSNCTYTPDIGFGLEGCLVDAINQSAGCEWFRPCPPENVPIGPCWILPGEDSWCPLMSCSLYLLQGGQAASRIQSWSSLFAISITCVCGFYACILSVILCVTGLKYWISSKDHEQFKLLGGPTGNTSRSSLTFREDL